MRGDQEAMHKDASTEAVYRAISNRKFIEDVRSVRKDAGLPLNGYKKPRGIIKDTELRLALGGHIEQLLRKYSLSPALESAIEEFVISNVFEGDTKPNYFACEYDYFIPPHLFIDKNDFSRLAKWKRAGKPFICVYIPEDVSLKNANAFLKTHWTLFSKFVFKKKAGQKSIRRSRHNKRDALILSYATRNRKQLGLKRGEYKDIRIASIMRHDHGYTGVTPEVVRSVINRRKSH